MTFISISHSYPKGKKSCCRSNHDVSPCVMDLNDASSSAMKRKRFLAAMFTVAMGVVCYRLDLHSTDKLTFEHTKTRQQMQLNDGRRMLWSLFNFFDPKTVELREPFGVSDIHTNSNMTMMEPSMAENFDPYQLAPYTLHNLKLTSRAFGRELFLLRYDPVEDTFLVYIDRSKDRYHSPVWSPIWSRLNAMMPTLTFALRNHFPDRFRGVKGGSQDFVTFVSSGDTPQLSCECIHKEGRLKRPKFCQNDIFAPILQFGSVHKDSTIMPSIVPMPIWSHMPCFVEWQRDGSVCQDRRHQSDIAGKLGGEDALVAEPSGGDLKQMPFSSWNALIPTLVWRGSDYPFLACLHSAIMLLDWGRDIAPRLAQFGAHAQGAIQSLLDLWDNLTPRWKAATLAAMARLDAIEDGQHEAPTWIDAKFTVKSKAHGKPVKAKMSQKSTFQAFEEFGIQVTSEKMMLPELSKYKYHIDFGGGGGTTWFGTIEKLGMPGVLLHHLTSTKDYYHDDLRPWKHYIPVNEDLSNLREMYDWAEANSKDAQMISESATEYIKNRAKPKVMRATYEKYFIHSLKRVVDACVPTDSDDAQAQMDDYLSRWFMVGKCTGDGTCDLKNWRVNKAS